MTTPSQLQAPLVRLSAEHDVVLDHHEAYGVDEVQAEGELSDANDGNVTVSILRWSLDVLFF